MKKAAGKTVGDLVKEGKLTPSVEEPTHVYEVETKKIEKIEPVAPPAKPAELKRWELGELNEKWAREEIIQVLTERRDLYVAHKVDCKDGAYPNKIHFYKPFLSPVALFARVKLEVPSLIPYNFDWAVHKLLQEGKISLVSQDTYTCDHPNDFRDARLGELFLNTTELVAAYQNSVNLSRYFNSPEGRAATMKALYDDILNHPPLVEKDEPAS